MEKTLTITWGHCEMHVSDIDEDYDVGVSILDIQNEDENMVYLNEEEIVSLRDHLDYIINKRQ